MPTAPAVFPSQIATDAQLKVAANLIETKLRIAINATDTVLFVASTVGFTSDMLVSIDKEIIAIGGVSPAPDSTLTVAAGGRGFDGTAAASHAAGVKVSVLIDAWHHNALASEVQAIEQALGPNLANILEDGIKSTAYAWTPQTPGGDLIVGNNVVALSPVPRGINGTNQAHYLYVSGGTGAPEACLITGGTAVSGAASGTVIVNCANAHTGAWTIRSATAGIQEALFVLPSTGGTVLIPAGLHTIYATVSIRKSGLYLRGEGKSATTVMTTFTGGPLIFLDGTNAPNGVGEGNIVENFCLSGPSAGANWAIEIADQNTLSIHRMKISEVANGIRISTGFSISISNSSISYCLADSGVALWIAGGADHFIDHLTISAATPPLAGIRITQSGGTWIDNCSVMGHSYGLLIDPPAPANYAGAMWISNTVFDNSAADGIRLMPAGVVKSLFFDNCYASGSGANGITIDSAAAGGEIRQIVMRGMLVGSNKLFGVQIRGANTIDVTITGGSDIASNGWNTDGALPGILIDQGASGITISDVYVGPLYFYRPAGVLGRNNFAIQFGAGATDHVILSNIRAKDYTSSMIVGLDLIAGTNLSVSNLVGVSDVSVESLDPLTIASAAALPLQGGAQTHFFVTGTAAVTSIAPAWKGREIVLTNIDSGNIQFQAGASIRNAVTINANETLRGRYDGVKWCLSK